MTALVVSFLLGGACGVYLPRAWKQAANADRLEALKGGTRRKP